MTLHVVYSYNCPECDAHYIPYAAGVVCPRCGNPSTETFDYIPEAAQSVAYNLGRYGTCVPPAWWIGSLGDHILHTLFPVFEAFRLQTSTDFSAFAANYLFGLNWGDQLYLRDHIIAIAVLVHDAMEHPATSHLDQPGLSAI